MTDAVAVDWSSAASATPAPPHHEDVGMSTEGQVLDHSRTQELMEVLGNELRRRYLKIFTEAEEPLSASMLYMGFAVSLHVSSGACRALARCGLIELDSKRPVRGAWERLYRPRVVGIQDPLIQAILAATPSQLHILQKFGV